MKIRHLFRLFGRFYKREYGKYTILNKYFFPYFAAKNGERDITFVNGRVKMALDTSEYIQGHLYVFNCFEPSTINFIEEITRQSDIVFDIGANIGYLTLIFSRKVAETGRIYAFEPEKENNDILIRNIELNSFQNIEPLKIAISDKKDKLKLFKSIDNNKGSHSIIFNEEHLSEIFEEIDTITFDEYIQENNIEKVDIIKIDVEGAEYEVIKGMTKSMEQFQPIIIMEMNNPIQEKRGVSTRTLKELVLNHGYKCYNILENGKLEISDLDYPHMIDNVVFVPQNKENRIKKYI